MNINVARQWHSRLTVTLTLGFTRIHLQSPWHRFSETIVHFIHRYISSIVVWECKSVVHAKFLLTIDDFS